jgi:DNA-binding GntR family transcriptional regulator
MQHVTQEGESDDRSIAAEIARTLGRRIVTGVIAPGEWLRQDHVAEEFRASHVPVREAFRRLEAQGLVRSEPRRGVRVAPLDPASVREITEMRAALEVLALREALPRITPDDLAEAARAIEATEASREPTVWEEANRRFHRALTAPCRMPRLLATIDDLHRVSTRYFYATWKGLDWEPRSEGEHRAILDAAWAGDGEAATKLLVAHIVEAGCALVRTL